MDGTSFSRENQRMGPQDVFLCLNFWWSWKVHGSTAASQQLGVINSDEAMELSMRHKDTVAVHFKTVLFYHFYHQDAIEWISSGGRVSELIVDEATGEVWGLGRLLRSVIEGIFPGWFHVIASFWFFFDAPNIASLQERSPCACRTRSWCLPFWTRLL